MECALIRFTQPSAAAGTSIKRRGGARSCSRGFAREGIRVPLGPEPRHLSSPAPHAEQRAASSSDTHRMLSEPRASHHRAIIEPSSGHHRAIIGIELVARERKTARTVGWLRTRPLRWAMTRQNRNHSRALSGGTWTVASRAIALLGFHGRSRDESRQIIGLNPVDEDVLPELESD